MITASRSWLPQHLAEVAVALAGVLELLHHSIAAGFPESHAAVTTTSGWLAQAPRLARPMPPQPIRPRWMRLLGPGLGRAAGWRGASKVRCGKADGSDRGRLFQEGTAGDRVVLIHRGDSSHREHRLHSFFFSQRPGEQGQHLRPQNAEGQLEG